MDQIFAVNANWKIFQILESDASFISWELGEEME